METGSIPVFGTKRVVKVHGEGVVFHPLNWRHRLLQLSDSSGGVCLIWPRSKIQMRAGGNDHAEYDDKRKCFKGKCVHGFS